MTGVVEWLMNGDPWVVYRTALDLLELDENAPEVSAARRKMLEHPAIIELVSAFSGWDNEVVSSHKKAGLLIHKLAFLADIGMKSDDPGMAEVTSKICERRDENDIIRVAVNVPVHFGGTGRDEWGWALCDTPTVMYSLVKLGLGNEAKVINGTESLMNLKSLMNKKIPMNMGDLAVAETGGWPCVVSQELGRFRGPGRKEDPCPYATLLMVKLLSQVPEFRDSDECRKGAACLLDLWETSRVKHPYLFYMGNDFRKLKAPFVWYDILHVADVLSQLEWLKEDRRLNEMTDIISGYADGDGRFTAQSEWQAWKGWEFGQKKQASQWITFIALRILKRMGRQYF
ncbi:MAG: hypothetical protein HGA22_02380 [Clostridiales bacterium]|nr:hypothetical protein [Clostridiales bacterium]